jgi:hypothetical protein
VSKFDWHKVLEDEDYADEMPKVQKIKHKKRYEDEPKETIKDSK